jgi:hypothetical protein
MTRNNGKTQAVRTIVKEIHISSEVDFNIDFPTFLVPRLFIYLQLGRQVSQLTQGTGYNCLTGCHNFGKHLRVK